MALGLELREVEERWWFVDSFQDPERSGVDSFIVSGLLSRAFICRDGSRASITEGGRNALRIHTEAIIQGAIEWTPPANSQFAIY
jgi:hypothetical protein